MNKELAEMYQNDAESVEKLAAAELAETLSDEGGLDLNGLTVEQIEELAKDVMARGEEKVAKETETEEAEETEEADEETETEEAEPKTEETEESEKTASELTDEDKQKLAEADYLGRVMAHSFAQESREIEKQAGAKDVAGKVGAKLKDLASKAKGKASGAYGKSKAWVDANPKKARGAAAVTGGAIGGGAALAISRKMKKEKKSAAATPNFDALVEARVAEILAANGVEATEEKTAAPSEEEKALALASAVEARAIETLKAQGYEIETEAPVSE